MNIELKEAVKRLERACVAGIDEKYRDDVVAVLDALAERQPADVEAVRYEYRFYRMAGDWNQREGWSGWADCRKEDYERISQHPEDGREVRALYPAPLATAVPVDVMRDAERYRWLREQSRLSEGTEDGNVYIGIQSDDRWGLSGHDADYFIDAAMLATHPQPAAAPTRKEPSPNWCRTCEKRPNDPAAMLCPDPFHRSAAAAGDA